MDEAERTLIVRCRARLRYVDTLPEPHRTWEILWVSEQDWAAYDDWIRQARGLMNGTLVRVWRQDHWATEKAR